MKKMIGLALVCVLTLSLAAGAFPGSAQDASEGTSFAVIEPQNTSPEDETEADDRYLDDPESGLRFLLPEVWHTALYNSPNISLASYPHGFSFEYLTGAGNDALTQLMTAELPEDEADFTPEQKGLLETYQKGIVPLCAFVFEKEGEREEDLRSQFTEEKVLGEKDGTTYTLLTNPNADLSTLTAEEQAQYKALLTATADFDKDMTLSGVKEVSFDSALSFASQTPDGKDIDSSVLQKNKLTLVNIWATWCGPCVGELPELQKLSENLPEGVGMLGICTDGADDPDTTKMLLEKCGVKYDNVSANEDMLKGFLADVQSLPTTIFVDSEGNMVGEPFVGAPSSDLEATYQAEIQKRLDMLGQ